MSGLQRYCIRHNDWVDQADAELVDAPDAGPSLPVYACRNCTSSSPQPAPTTTGDVA